MPFSRCSGVLAHPSSLPGPHGIGTIGDPARTFVDLLAEHGQSVWQVLPLNPTGSWASPYAATSSFAANPLLVDLNALIDLDLLEPADLEPLAAMETRRVDYARLIQAKEAIVATAGARLASNTDHPLWTAFAAWRVEEGPTWLDHFTHWEALSRAHGRAHWRTWSPALRNRGTSAFDTSLHELSNAIGGVAAEQYLFEIQWRALRAHACERGVRLIGDMPIFVAHDSADVWSKRHLFQLDAHGDPTVVAGVPPDYFSATGQLWGNPLYDWEQMAADRFSWWIARTARLLGHFDAVRIDHFRGFAAAWETPAGAETAVHGQWRPTPGHALFEALQSAFAALPFIAEDLGHITDDVIALRDRFGLPGLRILQFAFGDGPPRDGAHPYHYPANSVCYPGTHDNNTIQGWLRNDGRDAAMRAESAPREARHALELLGGDGADMHWRMMELALSSGSNVAIVQLQDILGLDGQARMNTPGSLDGNWDWRTDEDWLRAADWARLATLTRLHDRIPSRRPSDD